MVRVGWVYGVGQEGRAGWAGVGLGYGWVRVRVGWRTGWGVWGWQEGRDEGRVGRVWGGDRGGLGCVRVFWGNG